MTKYKIKNRTKEILNMLFEENGNKTKKEKKKRGGNGRLRINSHFIHK